MATLQQRKLLELTSENKQLMMCMAVAAYFQLAY